MCPSPWISGWVPPPWSAMTSLYSDSWPSGGKPGHVASSWATQSCYYCQIAYRPISSNVADHWGITEWNEHLFAHRQSEFRFLHSNLWFFWWLRPFKTVWIPWSGWLFWIVHHLLSVFFSWRAAPRRPGRGSEHEWMFMKNDDTIVSVESIPIIYALDARIPSLFVVFLFSLPILGEREDLQQASISRKSFLFGGMLWNVPCWIQPVKTSMLKGKCYKPTNPTWYDIGNVDELDFTILLRIQIKSDIQTLNFTINIANFTMKTSSRTTNCSSFPLTPFSICTVGSRTYWDQWGYWGTLSSF